MLESNPQLSAEHDAIAKKSGDEVVLERTAGFVSGMESYGIKELLAEGGKRKDDIKSLIIGGLSTGGCVISTAKAAADQGFVVTVLKDLCCDPKPGVHETLCEHVLPPNCHVSSVEEFKSRWAAR